MSRDELIEKIQRAADDHPRAARRALHRSAAERIADVVLGEVLSIVQPAVWSQWGGDVLLKQLRALAEQDVEK